MPAEVYEVVALAARFWFLLLMGLIVWYSYRWYARERRARKRLLKELPDAGFVGEFVLMQSAGQLEAGTAIRVPFEGTLGLLRNNDICLEVPGVAPRHIYFRYDKKRGLKMTPMKGNHFAADHTSSEDEPDGLYVVHGTRLYVGGCELRLRMFEGYEVTPPVQQPVPDPIYRRWGEPGTGSPHETYQQQQPVYAPASAARYRMPGDDMQPGAPEPAQQPPAAGYSPYGRRVHFPEDRTTDNPYRSRRSVPGLRRGAARNAVPPSPEPVAAAEPAAAVQPEEAPVRQTPTAAPAQPGFSAMSEYARMMAQPLVQEPEATPAQPAGPKAAPAAAPAQPAVQEAAPAANPRPGFAPADSTLRPARAEAIHRAPGAPGFAPAEEELPHVVFEESLPDDPAAEEELFHPLMDEDDWEAWEELPPPAQPAVQQRKEPKPAPRTTEEEDWPYLSRTDQWRTEGLFADLLDDDGTDAAALPGGAYGSRNGDSAARRMLGRYFKGGGR